MSKGGTSKKTGEKTSFPLGWEYVVKAKLFHAMADQLHVDTQGVKRPMPKLFSEEIWKGRSFQKIRLQYEAQMEEQRNYWKSLKRLSELGYKDPTFELQKRAIQASDNYLKQSIKTI